ncbi:MAG: hypothetical protein HC838_00625 [Spirulinaceae cyanobacterium RM2_2_10]|nr:hypothetical protein [Spirulinaceae cyanobacterium RM2_2_10]
MNLERFDVEIAEYINKWKQISIQTSKMNREATSCLVQEMYKSINKDIPRVFFFSSPYAALMRSFQVCRANEFLDLSLFGINFMKEISDNDPDFDRDCFERFPEFYDMEFFQKVIFQSLESQIHGVRQEKILSRCLKPENRYAAFCIVDFCSRILEIPVDERKWKVYSSIIKSCGWIFPFEKICLVSERPSKLSFDISGKLHSENETAIEFADGFGIYARHGELTRDSFPLSEEELESMGSPGFRVG